MRNYKRMWEDLFDRIIDEYDPIDCYEKMKNDRYDLGAFEAFDRVLVWMNELENAEAERSGQDEGQ